MSITLVGNVGSNQVNGTDTLTIVLGEDIPADTESQGGKLVIFTVRGHTWRDLGDGLDVAPPDVTDNAAGGPNSYDHQAAEMINAFPDPIYPSHLLYYENGSSTEIEGRYGRNSDGHDAQGGTQVDVHIVTLDAGYASGDVITFEYPEAFAYIYGVAYYVAGSAFTQVLDDLMVSWMAIDESGFDSDYGVVSELAGITWGSMTGSDAVGHVFLALTILQGARDVTSPVGDGDGIDDQTGLWNDDDYQSAGTGVVNLDFGCVIQMWTLEFDDAGAYGVTPTGFASSPSHRDIDGTSPYSGVVIVHLSPDFTPPDSSPVLNTLVAST